MGIQELNEALDRHTKMLRGPQGARCKGLKDSAFVPAIIGMWVNMPGGRHVVVSLASELKEVILFEAKRLLSIRMALKSLLSKANGIDLLIEDKAYVFACDGSRIRIKRTN